MVYVYTKLGCRIIISSGDKSRKSYFGNTSPQCELDDSNPFCFLHDNLPHCTMVIPLQPGTFQGCKKRVTTNLWQHHKTSNLSLNLITSRPKQNVNTRVLALLRNCHLHAQNSSGRATHTDLLVGHLKQLEGLLLEVGGLLADLLGRLVVLVGQQLLHLCHLLTQLVTLEKETSITCLSLVSPDMISASTKTVHLLQEVQVHPRVGKKNRAAIRFLQECKETVGFTGPAMILKVIALQYSSYPFLKVHGTIAFYYLWSQRCRVQPDDHWEISHDHTWMQDLGKYCGSKLTSKGFTISLFFYSVQSPFSDTWVFYCSPSKPWQTQGKQQVCPWETRLKVSVLLIPDSEEVMLSKGIVRRKLGWRKIEASLHDTCLHHLQIGENPNVFTIRCLNDKRYSNILIQIISHIMRVLGKYSGTLICCPIPHPLLKHKWPKAISCLCNTDNFYSET